MVELVVMCHKSTRLPIDLYHMAVCRIVTSNYFIRVISLGSNFGAFSAGLKPCLAVLILRRLWPNNLFEIIKCMPRLKNKC